MSTEQRLAYAARFATMAEAGDDLAGEARFVDTLCQRGATILDAGCGTGRTGAALRTSGHQVAAVDADPLLVAAAATAHPDLPVAGMDLAELSATALAAAGLPESYDVVVAAGNVLVYLRPGSERQVVSAIAGVLKPGGRFVSGFATDRDYQVADFDADLAAAGLVIWHRFGTWHLDPYDEDCSWVVTVAARA